MDKFSNVVNNLDIQKEQLKIAEETRLNEEAKKIVNHLFKILKIHTHFFDMNDSDVTRREWTKTFVANKINAELVKKGVENLRVGEKLKNITPLEFIELCKLPIKAAIPAAHQLYIPAPHPNTSRDVALAALKGLKQMLK